MGDLLPKLLSYSHQIRCLVHNHQPSFSSQQEFIEGVSVVRSPVWFRTLFTPISPWFGVLLRRQLIQFDPELVHVHMPNVSAFWLLVPGFRTSSTVVIHWHADVLGATGHFWLSLAYKLYRPLEQRLLARAHKIIVTSPNYIASSEPLASWRHKVQVVPLGLVDVTLNQRVENPANAKFKLLCIGRLTFYKGQEYLIRAMAGLGEVELDIVGQGEEFGKLASLIDQLGLKDVVRLHGFVEAEELESLLSNCDCLCLPSLERAEAFGVVLLEAMRASRPVIVSDVPGSGMSWVVDHEITGLLVQCGDISGLQSAIRQLQQSPDDKNKMGDAGREKFERDFTVTKIAEQIHSLYLSADEVKEPCV